ELVSCCDDIRTSRKRHVPEFAECLEYRTVIKHRHKFERLAPQGVGHLRLGIGRRASSRERGRLGKNWDERPVGRTKKIENVADCSVVGCLRLQYRLLILKAAGTNPVSLNSSQVALIDFDSRQRFGLRVLLLGALGKSEIVARECRRRVRTA